MSEAQPPPPFQGETPPLGEQRPFRSPHVYRDARPLRVVDLTQFEGFQRTNTHVLSLTYSGKCVLLNYKMFAQTLMTTSFIGGFSTERL